MSKNRILNFAAGPAVLPVEVLEEAKEHMLSLGESGIGIMEHSHRGKAYEEWHHGAEKLARELAGIPDNYHVLFLQGGASSQFFMVPMNFLPKGGTADYHMTGEWAKKAAKEAKLFGTVHAASSSEDRNCCYIPKTWKYSDKPAYVHMTSNNTIFGTQWEKEPDVPAGVPLICDASSDIFCRPIDIKKYAMIYAGAQKNLGPSGVTLVVIRDDMVQKGPKDIPTMLQYRIHAENKSLYNTPPTFGIFMINLVLKWVKKNGGLVGMAERNYAKANKLYAYLDQSKLFKATPEKGSRSIMNVPFVTGKQELDDKFVAESSKAGLSGLKGHRNVGGMRASIYNACPPEAIDALIEFMRKFEAQNAK